MPTQHRDDLVDPAAGAEPDFKTIADFRKNNSRAIREVCREFVALCFAVHGCEHVGHDARRDRVTSFENEADCSPSECESCLGSSAFRPPYHMNLQISATRSWTYRSEARCAQPPRSGLPASL